MSSRSSTSSQAHHTKHHRRSSHAHNRAPSSTTSSNSKTSSQESTTVTRIDPTEYNPHLYKTHLFIMRLIPSRSSPFPTTDSQDQAGKITSSSTPQWSWSTAQCQAWTEQVLIKREGIGRKEARAVAARVECDGAGLYGLGEEEWDEICSAGMAIGSGEKVRRSRKEEAERRDQSYGIARRICGMLKRRMGEDGAVPQAVRALSGR